MIPTFTPTPPGHRSFRLSRRPLLRRWTSSPTFRGVVSILAAIFASQFADRGPTSAIVAALGVTILWILSGILREGVRAARADRVITYVAQAIELGLPMPEFCRVAALAETPGTRRALQRLADSMGASMPIGDSLAAAIPGMAPREIGLARVGEANGTLPQTFARLAAVREPTRGETTLASTLPEDDIFVRPQPPLMYFALLLVGVAAVCMMLSIFVVPKFAQIFHDFGVPPPTWMRIASGGTWNCIDVCTALMLFIAAVVAIVIFTVRSRRLSPVRRVTAGDNAAPRWPIVDAWRNDRDCADICQTVADALAARRPADVAIGEAATLDLGQTFAGRTEKWRTFVAAGQPLGAAARTAGMPRLVGDLAGDRSSDAADAFAFLARHYRARSERTHEWLRAVASPILTLIAAVPVGLIAYALFDCLRLLDDAAMPKNLGM